MIVTGELTYSFQEPHFGRRKRGQTNGIFRRLPPAIARPGALFSDAGDRSRAICPSEAVRSDTSSSLPGILGQGR